MAIRWGSLVSSTDGEVEWTRVTHLLSGFACLVAVGLLVCDAFGFVPNSSAVDTAVWAGMLPITGGQIAGAISGKLKSSKIQAGAVPGRRASDTVEAPADG